MNEQPGLRVSGLVKSFGGVRALAGAQLDARRGEVHGILGENGAGKSTLIRVLSGVIGRDSGEVLLDGQALRLGTARAALASGIQTVFQESSLIPALTVEENLLFGNLPVAWHRRIRRRELRARYDRIIDSLEVRRLNPTTPVAELSVGDRQLLEVCRAFSRKPEVLVLDEATSALSLDEADWLLRRAREVAREGAVVLFVSHRLQEVRATADRLTVLRSGATVLEGLASEIDEDDAIAAMLGRRQERLYPERANKPTDRVVLTAHGLTAPGLGPVDIDLREGEILGLAALPGQGQRQLLMGLAGDQRLGGEITIGGTSYSPASPAEAQRSGVYLVPEDRAREALFLGHTVQNNLTASSLGLLTRWRFVLRRGAERVTARESARQVSIDRGRLQAGIETLSGGNQQKAIFGRVLANKPRVLILYDSTRGVDVGTKAELYELVNSLAAAGVGVVFFSTDLTEMLQMCDRIMVLYSGKVAGERTRDDGVDEEALLRLAAGVGARHEASDEVLA